MGQNFFDEMDSEAQFARPSKAIWSIDLDDPDNEKNILKWLQGEQTFLVDNSRERMRLMRRNISLYKGIQYETQDVRRDLRDRSVDRSRAVGKIVVNHLFDLTTNRVSRLVKFKPAVAILPTNDEFEDKNAAKSTEQLLSHIWYLQDFQGSIITQVAKIASIMGEAYLFITWDPEKGDKHPDSPEDGESITLLDENGAPEKDDLGNTIRVEEPVMVGDVDYEVVMPHDIYLQRARTFEKVDYCYRRRTMNVEEARLKWPKKTKFISSDSRHNEFDFETFQSRDLVDEVVIWEFWHKSTKGLRKGRYIAYTLSGVLENRELGYSHGQLPFERFTDDDIPAHLYGQSFFERVKALTSTYNNLTNLILANQVLCSHPKWVMPAGSAQLSSLGNDRTVIQYKGAVPPQLVQSNPTPRELFEFRNMIKEEFQQIAGVFGVSRGEPPPGVKAGVAMQFLNEQENERFNELTLKWNMWIKRTSIKTLSVAGDYYDSTDERMVRVLGKDEVWRTKFFDAAHLSKDYDIRIQNSSALSESKAQRTQNLLDLQERFPDQLSGERVLDMLDLAQDDKFIDIASVAVRTAEAENEEMLSGAERKDVEEYEDHVAHWDVHMKALQSYSFKETVPAKIQEYMKEHILVHEMMMLDKAKINPAFGEQLAALRGFPVFFTPESAAQEEEEAQQSAEPGAGSQGIVEEPGLPVNPELGGEQQLPVQEQVPPIELAGAPPPPVPASVESQVLEQ